MKKIILTALFIPVFILAADTQWTLKQSTLSYHISAMLHSANGVSKAARGKGTCHEGQCDFLIAVPVKSFDSGDSNRDLHMIQVTRGAEFPMVQVRTRLPESSASSSNIQADLDVEFAGQTVHYSHIPFQLKAAGDTVTITGTIPATLTDFKIDPPKLLTVPIKNEIPVKVEITWQRQ